MVTNFDAIIIGAGPAGASCAILLARAGWRVALVEKAVFPRGKVCGGRIAASTFPLLAALGVANELADLCGPPLRRLALIHRNQSISAALPPSADARHPWGRALRRERLDALLVERARRDGVTLFQPWEAHLVRGVPGEIACDISHAHWSDKLTLEAAILIDAQGSPERLPGKTATTPDAQLDSDLLTFKGSFENVDFDAGLLQVSSFEGGYAGLVVAARDTVTLTLSLRRDRLAACRKLLPDHPAADAAAACLAAACGRTGDLLAAAEQRGPWLNAGPLRPGLRMRAASGRVFQVGDAAGAAHPILGDGVDMAIESASLLAQLLIPIDRRGLRGQSFGHLHGVYVNAWHCRFAARIRLAWLIAQLAMRPALLRPVAPLARHFPALVTGAARFCRNLAGPQRATRSAA